MGWNRGYAIMEETVIGIYDAGLLTKELLKLVMKPYRDTDIDEGGSQNLKTKDGRGVEEVICAIMEPEAYKDVIDNPIYYKDEDPSWSANVRAYDLYRKIENQEFGIL